MSCPHQLKRKRQKERKASRKEESEEEEDSMSDEERPHKAAKTGTYLGVVLISCVVCSSCPVPQDEWFGCAHACACAVRALISIAISIAISMFPSHPISLLPM